MKRLLYGMIRALVAFFAPVFKVEGKENLPDGAMVIVGNPSQAFGPIAAELYVPGNHYTWCISEMMEKDRVADYAYGDFWSKKPIPELTLQLPHPSKEKSIVISVSLVFLATLALLSSDIFHPKFCVFKQFNYT